MGLELRTWVLLLWKWGKVKHGDTIALNTPKAPLREHLWNRIEELLLT